MMSKLLQTSKVISKRPAMAALYRLVISLVTFAIVTMITSHAATAKSLHPDYKLLRGEVQLYDDWLVGCDNNAECTIIGFPNSTISRNDAVIDMGMKLTIAGPASSSPTFEIFPYNETLHANASTGSRPFYLFFGFIENPPNIRHGFSRATLTEEESAEVLHTLSYSAAVSGIDIATSQTSVRFPSRGFSRAYRAMRARRENLLRDGRNTTQIPRRKIAASAIVFGLAPISTVEVCGRNLSKSINRFRFVDSTELWSFECANDTSQSKSYWSTAPNATTLTVPLELPEPRNRMVKAGIDGLENAVFDFDFGVLRSYKYQTGHTDCGEFRVWANTSEGWQLIERREMPLCKGLEPDLWIRTFHLDTDGPGPDE